MAGFDDPIEMDSDGEVLIGAVSLDNVRSVNISYSWEAPKETRTVFQGKRIVQAPGLLTATVTINMYQDNTIVDNYNAFRIGHSSGIGQTITIRQLGTGTGLPELIFNPDADQIGMNLIDAPETMESGENKPYAEASMTWEGTFLMQPARTAQA